MCSVDDAPYQYMGRYAPKVRKNRRKLHFFLWRSAVLLCVVISLWVLCTSVPSSQWDLTLAEAPVLDGYLRLLACIDQKREMMPL